MKRTSCIKPILDEDLRSHFRVNHIERLFFFKFFLIKDYLCRHRFNLQTFQLDLSNLADDEGYRKNFIEMEK